MEKFTKKIGLLILFLSLLATFNGFTQTSGLFYTAQEVEIWRSRSAKGPYKTTGDATTNSPGDWDRIKKNAAALIANPLKDHWKGTSGNAIQWATPEPHIEGSLIRDAAFVFLVTGEQKYKDVVQKALLAQAKEPLTDFSNKTRWPLVWDINPGFIVAEWLGRLLMAYDMINISDPTIDKFFKNGGAYCYMNVESLKELYADRSIGIVKQTSNSSDITHIGGFKTTSIGKCYNNRRASLERTIAMVGFKYSNPLYINEAKFFFKEFIKYSAFPDGTLTEFHRATTNNPEKGFAYVTASVNILIEIADLYARKGDTSLYDFITSDGINGTKGGTKSLKLIIHNVCKHIDGSIKRYAFSVKPENLIDGNYKNNWISENDIWFAQANRYYKDSYIKSIYTQSLVSNPAFSGSLPVFVGTGGLFPGKLFMFGQMENLVNPYNIAAGSANSTPTVSAGSDLNITLPTSSVNVVGSASDSDGSISSYTWTKQSGPSVTLSNTTKSTLTLTNLVAGTYTFRLTVKDNAGATAYDEVKVIAANVSSLPVENKTSFYRAININGPALTIDGNNWEGGSSASNFTFSGRTFANQGITLSPATDANRASMIRSNIYRNSGANNVSVSLKSVPTGNYDVFVYIWEDNNSVDFELLVESKKVGTFSSGSKGSWKKISLGTTYVTDGSIDVSAVGGDTNLSGIEVHKAGVASNSAPAVSAGNDLNIKLPVTSIDLSGNASDSDGSIASYAWTKQSGPSVTLANTNKPTLTLTNITAGTYVFRLRVKDDAGASSYDEVKVIAENVTTLPIESGPTFFRAININGPALTIDGNKWESGSSASNFTFVGRNYANQNITLNPSTDANRASMIRSNIYRIAGSTSVSLSVKSVPTGYYDAYVYVWEDNNSASFELFIESKKVGNYTSGNAGSWKRIALGRTHITDGTIDVKAVGGDANLSGIEIYKAESLSGIAALSMAEETFNAYPNPFIESLTVEITPFESESGIITLAILDLAGLEVNSTEVKVSSGQTEVGLEGLGNLEVGNYVLQIKTNKTQRVIRVIKK